jgi:hypothetical protein
LGIQSRALVYPFAFPLRGFTPLVLPSKNPMRKIFPGCCAWANAQSAKSMVQSAIGKMLTLLLLLIAGWLMSILTELPYPPLSANMNETVTRE